MSSAEIEGVLPPCPATKRGYGIQLHASSKGDLLAYTNGKNVIVRSIENPSDCRIFGEHKCPVSVAKFSPNGEWVASGDGRGRVLVWSVKTHMIKSEVNVCRNVLDIDWSPDGKRIVAVGDGSDSYARAFMWDSGNTVGDITSHSQQILSCSYRPVRPFRVATCAEDKQVNFYSGPPFRFSSRFAGHTRYPNQVRFAPDGSRFISVGSDKQINVFDGKSGEFLKELSSDEGHSGSIWSFSWSPDSKEILTVSSDSTAKIWNVDDSTVVTTFVWEEDGTNSHQQVGAVWHNQHLITVSLSGTINFLDRSNPAKPLRVLNGHTTPVSGLAVDRKSKTIYSTAQNGLVLAWHPDTTELRPLSKIGDGSSNIPCVGVSGSDLITAGFDDVLRVSSLSSTELCMNGENTDGQPASLGIADDGTLALVTRKNVLALYRHDSKLTQRALSFRPTAVAIASDASEVAVAGDKAIHLFSVEKDELVEKSTLDRHTDTTYCVAYSDDGRYLASGDGQRYIYVWNRASGTVMNTTGWRFHSARVTDLAFSPDSSKLASTSVDQNLLVWTDLDKFASERIQVQPAHIGGAQCVEFLDNDRVVSIGDDRAVKVWRLS